MADAFDYLNGYLDPLSANLLQNRYDIGQPTQQIDPSSQQVGVQWRDGQPTPYTPPTNADYQEAKSQAYGMTGIPDVLQGYQAYQRGEYLPALGLGVAGASNLVPGLGGQAARLAERAAPAIGRAATDVLPMLQGLLADESGALRLGRAATTEAPALSMPFISKGSDAPIFDTSLKALQDVPNVPQSSLIRPDEFARGMPARYTQLATPENLDRVDEAVKRGLEMPGGIGWYNTMQLLDRFKGEHGEQLGTDLWQRYMDYVAATSARTPVPENIRTASYLYALDRQGLPFPRDFGVVPGERNARWLGEKPPSPYGMLPNNMQQAINVREGGGLNPLTNPKISSFAENLQGNYAPLTADVHNLRLLGYPKDSPDLEGYAFLENLQRQRANALGITPAQYQSSGWVGAAKQTGVQGAASGAAEMPFLQRFEGKLRDTAAVTGYTPQQVLDRFIRGELMLR